MVGRWGMSATIGPVAVLPPPGQLVDEEVWRLVEDCYDEAVRTLRSNRDRLDRLAHTLFDRETLNEERVDQAEDAVRGETPGRRRLLPEPSRGPPRRRRTPRTPPGLIIRLPVK